MHACTCTHAHLYMYRNCKMATDMEASMFSMFNMHVHACVCMYACMGHPPHTHTNPPFHPSATPPVVDPQNHLKFDNTSTYQDISIPFEDLKSVKNSPRMGGCVVWWVGGWVVGWVDGWGQVKSLKILKLLTESRWLNPVWRFMICRDTPTHGWVWVCGWVNGWSQVKWLTIE